ncbi:MAG: ComEA family DNA-binding protein [Actinomyces sp.]|nr:ComEA family DNA-binding protein [Actinomyces sp.]
MAALTKAVYDSALTEDDEPAEPSVARLLPGGASVAALIAVVVLIAAVGVWRHAATREHSQALAQSSSEGEESEAASVAAGPSAPQSSGEHADVVVYVSGAVASPGVLTLPATSRVIDAITAAGGATPEADLESINLARILVDGEQIRVGVVGESPPPASAGTGTDAQACVRLATATETELQTLPGVGPALAQRIISYRATHPRLTSVEELDDVPGIGPSLIEKIRPGVC